MARRYAAELRSTALLPFGLVAIALVMLPRPTSAADVHASLLAEAAQRQEERRTHFAAVKTPADVARLQKSLRERFLALLDGLPQKRGTPAAKVTGTVEADDYIIEKLVFESLPGYFVPAVLYKPRKLTGRVPGVISPCGHSAVGKAAATYQILHVNLVKRGYIVLSYDPVGQGERSQFWDADKGKSRFNLVCGEHAVLGNPLYLLGTSLARYRIWDGMRAIDYLTSLPDVDSTRIGCVGNSGGGTLTAYIAALDERVKVAAICCYITTLPRRMGNRIEADPDADPEQDIFGFVSEGIDHAGLLALRAPRPTLLGAAQFDFFPIEGARESFAEAKSIFTAAGAPERIEIVEAAEKHGLTLPLRTGVYRFFERWLRERQPAGEIDEIPVKPRPTDELLVCPDGQVNLAFRSRHLLTVALDDFQKSETSPRRSLRQLLRLDDVKADFRIHEIAAGEKQTSTVVICVNGNETRGWQEEEAFLDTLKKRGFGAVIVDPRGVGALRPKLTVKGHDYSDPLVGVEENIAYNAFLLGKSLLGLRVADVSAAVQKVAAERKGRIILCGRRDAGLVACFTAALEPGVTQAALDETLLSYCTLFSPAGQAFNAASIVPGMWRNYGDIPDVIAEIAPRRMLATGSIGSLRNRPASLTVMDKSFVADPDIFLEWSGN